MANSSKLNDLQLILLSAAAQRNDGSVLPAITSIANEQDRISQAIPQLLKRKLIEEVPAKDRRLAWREQDEQPIGLKITEAGRSATNGGEPAKPAFAKAPKSKPGAKSSIGETKASIVIKLLQRVEGATLKEIVDATGWLPHTTRAALTGFRKKGHVVDKAKRDDVTRYRIAEGNPAGASA